MMEKSIYASLMAMIGLLLYSLYLTPAFSSGTYTPPVLNSGTPSPGTSSSGSAPNSGAALNSGHPSSGAPIDNRYNKGKEYIFGQRPVKKATASGCSSCHSGARAFKRSSLLAKQGQLAQIIQNCNGPHRVYCKNGKSTLSGGSLSTILLTLKSRYKLGN